MHLTLSPWQDTDAGALAGAVRESPDLAVQLGATPGTEAEALDFLRTWLRDDERTRSFAIRTDGVAVGNVGLSQIEHRHDTAWVSYWVSVGARGRGVATWACRRVAELAFADLGLFRLELGHRVNNPASCRVATAAGFAAEGVERARLRYGTERFDVETHARLATDA